MTLGTTPQRNLRSITPYIPGKSIASVQRELGLKNVVKLASNENPLGPSPRAMAVYRKAEKLVSLYPEGESPELRKALAKHHGLEYDQILATNGSDEGIRLLCEAFLESDDEVIVSQYGFIRFRQQATIMGARLIEVPVVDWTHDLETMGKTANLRTKLLFVANPNNPTGTYNTQDEVERLLDVVPPTTMVVLDEAYYQYACQSPDYPRDTISLLSRHPNLAILRTFSKAYGLAGLRVGYIAADSELIGWLDRIRMPFNLNLPAQMAAIEALKDVSHVKRSVSLATDGREVLAQALRSYGFNVIDSAANFLFTRSPIPGREIFKALLKAGVIIRPLEEYGLSHHVRITVGTASQNKALIAAVKAALGVSAGRH